jgi:hypothetical protein
MAIVYDPVFFDCPAHGEVELVTFQKEDELICPRCYAEILREVKILQAWKEDPADPVFSIQLPNEGSDTQNAQKGLTEPEAGEA